MVNVLTSSVVDLGIQAGLGQTRDNKTVICCFSVKNAVLGVRPKTG